MDHSHRLSYSHGREFVAQIRPILEQHNQDNLVRYLDRHWPRESLVALLHCGDEDAVKTSLVCLSVVGEMEDGAGIAPILQDEDGELAALAEHALWSIWFRAGDAQANGDLYRAVELLSLDQFDQAIAVLAEIVDRCPGFAEAHHQLAIACFLNGDCERAIEHGEAALRLNGCHFGALASLGHCYASIADLGRALSLYHESLQVHPRMEGIRQSIQQIREIVRRREEAEASRR